MKRILSLVLAAVLLCGCVFALASCGKTLSGKYEMDATIYTKTYEFKGKEFTCVRSNKTLGLSQTASGTYEITEDDEGNTFIAFTYGEDASEEAKEDAAKLAFVKGEEDGVKYIKIAGIKYKAVK